MKNTEEREPVLFTPQTKKARFAALALIGLAVIIVLVGWVTITGSALYGATQSARAGVETLDSYRERLRQDTEPARNGMGDTILHIRTELEPFIAEKEAEVRLEAITEKIKEDLESKDYAEEEETNEEGS